MTQAQLQTAEMADIPSLSVRLRRRLSVPAGIEDLSDAEGILLLWRMIGLAYVELLLRAANVRAASDDTSAESGPLHRIVSYPDWKRQSLFAWMAFLNYYQNQ